ncbi:hypothetical protein JZ751_005281 [Albula glossodonta]|uniref:Uncharacterized protein n=1 Tax=Albula glossodonta TaxID=121402 RepID=A0A8T2N4K7_9TELE|nr:hypothetical protein JZ751_005281 [Albula glossodonta]
MTPTTPTYAPPSPRIPAARAPPPILVILTKVRNCVVNLCLCNYRAASSLFKLVLRRVTGTPLDCTPPPPLPHIPGACRPNFRTFRTATTFSSIAAPAYFTPGARGAAEYVTREKERESECVHLILEPGDVTFIILIKERRKGESRSQRSGAEDRRGRTHVHSQYLHVPPGERTSLHWLCSH